VVPCRFRFPGPRGAVTDAYRHERLEYLRVQVENVLCGADLAVIEDMPYGMKGSAVTGLAGLQWVIRHQAWKMRVPYVVVNVRIREKWITGRGNPGKDACLIQVLKRFPDVEVSGNDEADALTLAAMAADQYGFPLAKMPASADEQLAKVAWPALVVVA
jgi:crossover junction endodeoxyribonuclease RuvC